MKKQGSHTHSTVMKFDSDMMAGQAAGQVSPLVPSASVYTTTKVFFSATTSTTSNSPTKTSFGGTNAMNNSSGANGSGGLTKSDSNNDSHSGDDSDSDSDDDDDDDDDKNSSGNNSNNSSSSNVGANNKSSNKGGVDNMAAADPDPTCQLVNENDGRLQYTGAWTLESKDPNGIYFTSHTTTTAGSEVSITFNGKRGCTP